LPEFKDSKTFEMH